jgi:hypothetical protein
MSIGFGWVQKCAEKGLWNENNPHVLASKLLKKSEYYLVIGRVGAGTDEVNLELFINLTQPVATGAFPVNPNANPSKMANGQERDATNHPGVESFDGGIARFLISSSYRNLLVLMSSEKLVDRFGLHPWSFSSKFP